MSAHQEIEHLRTSINDLSESKTRLEEERDLVEKRYDQLQTRIQATEQALDALQRELELCAHGSTDFTTSAAVELIGCETLIERLKAKRDLFKKRYQQLDARIQDIEQALDALQQELNLCVYGSTDLTTPNGIDLSGCETLIERLERIAVTKGGELYIPAAREILYAEGASSADPNNLRSSILKKLKKNDQDWEFVEDRTYRYKRSAEKGDEGPQAENEAPHGMWYNSSNDDGATECLDHSEAPGPPERRCPQWPTHSLDYVQSLINQQDASDLADDDSPSSRRLSGSLPEPAPDATREPISGEANMSTHKQLPPWQGPHNADALRVARGQRIAASTPITKTEDGWTIPSESRPSVHYRIWTDEDGAHCDCPDAVRTCKHILALRLQLDENQKAKAVPALAPAPVEPTVDTPPPPSNGSAPTPATPPDSPEQLTFWQVYYRAQTNEGELFPQLLQALCALVPEDVSEGRGRPSAQTRDLLFGEIMREYTGLSSRRCHPGIKQAAADGYISNAYTPNVGTNFLNKPETTDLLRALITESARPLRKIERTFAPDSSGFSTCTYDRWRDDKNSPERVRAHYVKTHIIVGVKSHIITAAAASVEPVADINMLPPLLEETRGAQFTVEELVADAAYLSEPILEWLRETGTEAWIPFRANSRFHYDESLWDRHLATFLLNQELFAEHYHQRSQVETTFSMVKVKYGSSVRGKTRTSQANGVLCKLLANNLYVLIRSIYELGLAPEFEKIGTLQNPAK